MTRLRLQRDERHDSTAKDSGACAVQAPAKEYVPQRPAWVVDAGEEDEEEHPEHLQAEAQGEEPWHAEKTNADALLHRAERCS